MNCPDCDGPMWDNRETKKNPKQPDFKCKNKACDKAVWLKPKESGAGAGAQAQSANGRAGNGATRPTGPLAPVYAECMDIAARAVKHFIGDKATAADIVAATATLFIGATNTGRPVKKAVAPPPKPKPAPAPPPQYDEDEELSPALQDQADDLPF